MRIPIVIEKKTNIRNSTIISKEVRTSFVINKEDRVGIILST